MEGAGGLADVRGRPLQIPPLPRVLCSVQRIKSAIRILLLLLRRHRTECDQLASCAIPHRNLGKEVGNLRRAEQHVTERHNKSGALSRNTHHPNVNVQVALSSGFVAITAAVATAIIDLNQYEQSHADRQRTAV